MDNTTQQMGYSQHNQIDLDSIYLYRDSWPETSFIDLKDITIELNIYEDIFHPSVTAILSLADPMNIPDNFPIVGGERIRTTFKTPTYDDWEINEWVIYKIGDRIHQDTNSRTLGYNLYLCTVDCYNDAHTQLSMGYTGKYSEIVPKILASINSKTQLGSDESMGIVTYVAPYWPPLKICSMFAKRAFGSDFEPFIFYEDLDGYNFNSMNSVLTNDSYTRYYIEPRKTQEIQGDLEKAFRSIISWEYLPSNDKLLENREGLFGADVYMHDPVTMSLQKNSVDYTTAFTNTLPTLDQYPIYDDVAKTDRKMTTFILKKKDGSHQAAINRKMLFGMLHNYRMRISIPGDSYLRAGFVIDLDIPSRSVGMQGNETVTSGRWLIAALKHTIRPDKYSITAEICKESYSNQINIKTGK